MVATTLRRGQLAIIQINSEDADDPHITGTQSIARDSISFVLLAPVGSGTTIYFTDRAWTPTVGSTTLNAGGFASAGGDGTYVWTAATDLAAGTVITITQAELSAAGMSLDTGGTGQTSQVGEAIYAYQGPNANTPSAFLFAIEFADANGTFNASLGNTGLTVGDGAFAIGADNASFAGRTWNQQVPVLFSAIHNASNWVTNENSPQPEHVEGTNLFTAPDLQLWIAGISGGHGLIVVNGDATQNGGLGYAVQHLHQNTSNDGNGLTTTSRFWSPTHILFDTVDNKYFIVDSSGTFDRILQGSISDTLNNPGVAPAMTILYSEQPAVSDGSGVTGHIVDTVNNHIYFTRGNQLLRINFDGANQTPVLLADLGPDGDTGNPNFSSEIALDLANGRAFIVSTETFSDFISVPAGTPGAIPDGGGGWALLTTTVYQNSIHMVSNIASNDVGIGNNTVVQLSFNEAFDEDNGTFGAQSDEFDDVFGRITSIDVNQVTGEIWFTTVQLYNGVNGAVGGIYRATLSGTTLNVAQIYSEGATNYNFQHIHVDEETGFYYATSAEPGEAGRHSVFRGALNAAPGTAPTLFSEVGNINEMTPRDLTVESAPTLTGNALAAAVTEASNAPGSGETNRPLLFGSVVASDIDTSGGDELAGAQVRISANFQSGATHQDMLRITGQTSGTISGSGIAYSYNSTTGVMTLTGPATVAEYAAALQLVTFSTSGDDITAFGTAGTRTIRASVFDGLLYSDELTATVTVTGINDAPVATPGAAMNFVEDTTGGVGNGTNVPPVNGISGISVSDVDADPANDDITVTFAVAQGTLTIRTNVVGGIEAGDVVSGNGTGTIVVTATQNQINATLAAMSPAFAGPPAVAAAPNGLVFTPPANVNGAIALTITTNDRGGTGNDPGLTGTGTSEESTATKTIGISAINDAPTVVNGATQATVTIPEDSPSSGGETVASLFGGHFSDALDNQTATSGSSANTLAGIAVTVNGSSAATGQWQYSNGTSWVDIGAASAGSAQAITAATAIRFNPATNYNGAAPALTALLIESGGAAFANGDDLNVTVAGGTTRYSATGVTLSGTVTAVNDAPVWSAAPAVAAVEQTETAILTGVTVADVELAARNGGAGNYAGAVLSVNRDPASNAEDVFSLVAGGGFTISGSNLQAGGLTFATWSVSASGFITVTFTSSGTPATSALVNAVVQAIRYTNTSDAPPASVALAVGMTDGGGDGSQGDGGNLVSVRTVTVNLTNVNDEPTGTDKTITIAEDGSHAFAAADFGFSDVEGNALSGVVVTTLPTSGTLTLGSTAIPAGTFVPVTDLGSLVFEPTADANGTGYATFTFQVRDNGGTTGGGQDTDQSPNTITFDVTPVNDAPVLTLSGAPASYVENAAPVVIAGTATVADVDNANFAGGTLTVAITAGAVALDGLSLPTAGNVAVDTTTGTVTVGGVQIGTVTAQAAGSATVTFNADATAARVTALAQSVGFVSLSEDPGSGARTVTFTLTDGAGGSTSATRTVSVTPIDDAPVLGADSGVATETAGVTIAVLGNDSDVDGPAPAVTHIAGQAVAPGGTVTIGSGAQVTLNANGTLAWAPNGAFDYLVAPATAAAAGASNGQATDSFTYSVGGVSATVTVTVTGVDSPSDLLRGTGGDDTLTGTGGTDLFDVSQGGADSVSMGAGDDGVTFGAAFGPGDFVDGGDGTNDQVALAGDYSVGVTFSNANMRNVELIAFQPGAGNNYVVTTTEDLIGPGGTMIFFASLLDVGQNLTINGAAETDGSFRVYGGLGTDTITTGGGDDGIYFGPGRFDPTVDRIDGGAGANDQLALEGSYTTTLDGTAIRNVEVIVLLPGLAAAPNSFNITVADSLTAAGATRTIQANLVSTALTIDASAESDATSRLVIYGGRANDTLTGGAGGDTIFGGLGADRLTGGGGADVFQYLAVAQSTSTGYDTITDFDYAVDTIDLPGTYDAFTRVTAGSLSTASFDADLTAALDGLLGIGGAVVFTASGGTLNGVTFVVVDANGQAGYQAGDDYVIRVDGTVPPTIPDFII